MILALCSTPLRCQTTVGPSRTNACRSISDPDASKRGLRPRFATQTPRASAGNVVVEIQANVPCLSSWSESMEVW